MVQLVGDFDWKALCMPTLPWSTSTRKMPFFGRNDETPILIAAIMGLQHAFAMIGGLIVPPFVVMKFSVNIADVKLQQYAIAASLIISGICTIVNCIQIPIPGTKFVLGTGMLSVIGTSFGFLPIYEAAIAAMKADGVDPMDAYGKMLGTTMVCCLLEIVLAFLPKNVLRKLFPPVVTGPAVMLIGAGLTGTGMKYWGGGAVCADMAWKNHQHAYPLVGGFFPQLKIMGTVSKEDIMASPMILSVNQTLAADMKGDSGFRRIPAIPGTTSTAGGMKCGGGFPYKTCCEAGDVALPFGSPELVGLGFSVILMLIVVELFGSPFMKNCNVVIALLFGYFVAGISEKCIGDQCWDYITNAKIESAESITFLWTTTFKLGFYGPAVFPMIIAFIVTTVETIGDIAATYEASEEPTDTEEYDKSIQGGLLSDGVCSFFAAIGTGMPNTTFSQNNGVISLTKCASRRAGVAAGCWLLFMGVIAKISGVISTIPDCVLGGMTTFLFCNVFVSGLKVVSACDLNSRRNRVILAVSMGLGLGVAMVPYIVADFRASGNTSPFWPCSGPFREGDVCSDGEKGIRQGVIIFLSTPYCIGTIVALILNLILPKDMEVIRSEPAGAEMSKPV